MRVLKVFGVILIGIVLICGVSVAVGIIFKDKVPIAADIPEPEEYKRINSGDYAVVSRHIENSKNATITYQSTKSELEHYGQEIRYISGRIEPLTSQESMRGDIPTDTISSSSSSSVIYDYSGVSDFNIGEDGSYSFTFSSSGVDMSEDND